MFYFHSSVMILSQVLRVDKSILPPFFIPRNKDVDKTWCCKSQDVCMFILLIFISLFNFLYNLIGLMLLSYTHCFFTKHTYKNT